METAFYLIDLGGTLVFAVAGAFRAVRHGLDLLGLMVLAVATGVGGGLMRDVILGATPPAAFRDEWYLVVCLLGGAVVFWIAPRVAQHWNRVMIADAIGLGVFAAIGAAKALAFGLGPIGVTMLGAMTATGGGVIRDVLVREIPAVVRHDFYATAALIGSFLLWGAAEIGLAPPFQLGIAAVTTTGLRFLAMFRKMELPRPEPLPTERSEAP